MKKKVWIIIGIVGIILFTCGGVMLFQSNHKEKEIDTPVTKPDPSIENPSVEEEKEESISLELAEELYKMLHGDFFCGAVYMPYYQYDIVTPNIISNNDKNKIVIRNLFRNREKLQVGTTQGDGNPIFTREQIWNMKNQIFGENTSFELNIGRLCMEKFEVLEDDKYSFETHCGGICFPSMATKFVKTVKKGDKIYLDQLVVFVKSGEYQTEEANTAYYYQDYNRTILLGQKEFLDETDYFQNSYRIDWNDYQDKAGQYRFTYQINEDGTYTFLQMERIK